MSVKENTKHDDQNRRVKGMEKVQLMKKRLTKGA